MSNYGIYVVFFLNFFFFFNIFFQVTPAVSKSDSSNVRRPFVAGLCHEFKLKYHLPQSALFAIRKTKSVRPQAKSLWSSKTNCCSLSVGLTSTWTTVSRSLLLISHNCGLLIFQTDKRRGFNSPQRTTRLFVNLYVSVGRHQISHEVPAAV